MVAAEESNPYNPCKNIIAVKLTPALRPYRLA